MSVTKIIVEMVSIPPTNHFDSLLLTFLTFAMYFLYNILTSLVKIVEIVWKNYIINDRSEPDEE